MASQDPQVTMHSDVLPPAQQSVLRQLGPIATALDFYLGGGTAVAIRIGHRQSVDLDWFGREPMADPLALAGHLRSEGFAFDIQSVDRGTLDLVRRCRAGCNADDDLGCRLG